jgi:hypothetical protein
MMYESESDFANALRAEFNILCPSIMVQRIESGMTSVGIPDLFLAGVANHLWVELKNLPKKALKDTIQIPFRAGQQGWAHEYRAATNKDVLVCVALKDCIIVLPMYKYFNHNFVSISRDFVDERQEYWTCGTARECVYKFIHILSGG